MKKAITIGKIRACVLDVWGNEPNIDIELLDMVDFGTPHIAGYSYDGKVAGMIMIYKAFCKFFGIEPKNTIADFLPRPEIERIVISEDKKPLLTAVNKLYDIRNDDAKLRRIKSETADNRGAFFDSLRKNYHIRREFQNTIVCAEDERLKKIFEGLGFKAE